MASVASQIIRGLFCSLGRSPGSQLSAHRVPLVASRRLGGSIHPDSVSGAPVREHARPSARKASAAMSKVPFHFSELHGKVVWTRESTHARPCVGFSLRPSGDYHPRRRRGPVFLLLGFSTATALGITRHGSPADSILALVRAATAAMMTNRLRKN